MRGGCETCGVALVPVPAVSLVPLAHFASVVIAGRTGKAPDPLQIQKLLEESPALRERWEDNHRKVQGALNASNASAATVLQTIPEPAGGLHTTATNRQRR